MVRSDWLPLVQDFLARSVITEWVHLHILIYFVDHKLPVNLDCGLQKQRLRCPNRFSFFFKEAIYIVNV